MLYAGPVDEMVRNHGSVLLSATDKDELKAFINSKTYLGMPTPTVDGMEVTLKDDIDLAKINKEAFDSGIILTQLYHKKQSLEDQFIELTKNN